MKDLKKEIGSRLKKFREQNNIAQSELADTLGMTQGNVSSLESGRHGLQPENLYILSKKYKIDLNWLITGKAEIPQSSTDKKLDTILKLLKDGI